MLELTVVIIADGLAVSLRSTGESTFAGPREPHFARSRITRSSSVRPTNLSLPSWGHPQSSIATPIDCMRAQREQSEEEGRGREWRERSSRGEYPQIGVRHLALSPFIQPYSLEAALADLAIRYLGVTLLGTVEEERGRQEGACTCRGGGKPVSSFSATNSTPLPAISLPTALAVRIRDTSQMTTPTFPEPVISHLSTLAMPW